MKQPGVWAGRGAERLGLCGPVERSQFVALLRNEDPTSGKRLTARTNTIRQENGETVSNRQVGYGLVFGVAKSLSIYLAITGDQVVENIARSAVDETMHAMEGETQCKVRKGGLHEDRRTGEMLYSMFFHRDSRPINGVRFFADCAAKKGPFRGSRTQTSREGKRLGSLQKICLAPRHA